MVERTGQSDDTACVSGQRGALRTAMRVFVRGVAIPAVVVIAVVNLIGALQPDSAADRLQRALKARNYKAAAAVYREQIEADFYDLVPHRGYILAQVELSKTSRHRAVDPLEAVRTAYTDYTRSGEAVRADIGWYGLGFLASLRGDWLGALAAFGRVQNPVLVYLNNSLGYVYFHLGDTARAAEAFEKELSLNGNLEGAYTNLARLYEQTGDTAALTAMLEDPAASGYMPRRIWRMTALKAGMWGRYLAESLRMDYVTACGLAAAMVVLGLWFVYLRRLDVFEPEPVGALLLTLGMAMALSMLSGPLYDLADFGFGLRLGGGLGRDLLYCIVGIGLIEETLKIIPFLLMLRLSRQVNESLDYVIYAAISALGFAFMENLLYFQDPGLGSITGRMFTAALMHMSLTAFAAYGLFYARYRKGGRRPRLYFALTFAAACVVHGLYDFWLLGSLDAQWMILSLAILLICVQVFSNMVKNGLNQSEFNPDARERVEYRTRYLVYSLSAVFLLQYLLLAWRWGADNANIGIVRSSLFLYVPLLVIFGNLGTIQIRKDRWVPLLSLRRAARSPAPDATETGENPIGS